MWARIVNIWQKEVMDSLRDKKALRQAILVPLIIGFFYAGFNPWINSVVTAKAQAPLVIPAQGIENADPQFIAALKNRGITLEPFAGDLRAEITKGNKNAGLIIPPGFKGSIASEQLTSLTLLTNVTSGGIFGGGGFSADRLNLAVSDYSRAVVGSRVQSRNISPDLLQPVSIQSQDLATHEQLAGFFAAFTLPILLGSIIAQGGLFVAIDVTAGEKERGTLEALLVTPASDVEVLTGKLLAVFTVTCIPIVLTFMGFWAGSQVTPSFIPGALAIPLAVILRTILLSLPLALFVDVVLMIVSVRTKAFKDAQSAAVPVSFGSIAPAMAAAFITPTSPLMFLIPIYGPAALVSALATGADVPAIDFVFAVLGSLLAGAVGYLIALRFFNRERLLYGV